MHPLFEYLLKANGLLICFYLLYKFVLAKDTFFQFSRYYLLGGIVVSVVLPFITFTKIQYIEVKEVFIPKSASTETVSFIPVTSTEPVHSINWETIMLIAYGVIASILILKLLIGLGKLFSVIKQSERIEKQRRTYLQSHLVQSPFSFFNYIVYNPELINQDELEAILLHEEAHSNQNHSVDTLLVQFITIFFWFNPVVWLYQKSVVQNLEFLADEAAIAQVKDRIVYQKAMLKFNTKTASFVASNSFNQSLIKKRIVMLNTKQTNKNQAWKFGLILPVLVGFMLLFQIEIIAMEKKPKIISKNSSNRSEMYLIEKNTSDKELKGFSEKFRSTYKIDLNFNKIKRNKANELTQINISLKNEKGKKLNQFISGDEAIVPVQIIVRKSGNSFDFEISEEFPQLAEIGDELVEIAEIAQEETEIADGIVVPEAPEVPIMDFDFPTPPDVPNMPDVPEIPENMDDKKAWKKYEDEIKVYEKKIKDLEPEWKNYEKEMKVFELKMKQIEPELKKYEKKMKEIEPELKKYDKKMEEFERKIKIQEQRIRNKSKENNKA